MVQEYCVHRAETAPAFTGDWSDPAWGQADTLTIERFLSVSVERPLAQARFLYDGEGIHGIYRSEERHVTCTHMEYQSNVFLDSCVEAFFRPKPDKGYVTFEMNCCSVYLTYYIADWTPKGDRFVDYTVIPEEVGREIRVLGSLQGQGPITQEIAEVTDWTLQFFVPFSYLERFVGPLGEVRGQTWRAQFNKCAFGASRPHGASWTDLGGVEFFHQPDRFGLIRFE